MNKESKADAISKPPWGYELFQHLEAEHGLILTECEVEEICRIAGTIRTEKLITQWESRLRALGMLADAVHGRKTDKARRIRCQLGTTHAMLDELKAAVDHQRSR